MSSSDAGVPGSSSILDTAEGKPIGEIVTDGIGGIIWSFMYLFVAPIRQGAINFANLIDSFLTGLAQLVGIVPEGSAGIIAAGAQESQNALVGQGLAAFIISFILVFLAVWIWAFGLDIVDQDIPFFGRVLFIGPDEED